MTGTDGQSVEMQGARRAMPSCVPPTSPDRNGRRRAACPSLAVPMATGDGLLARLRPTIPDLTIAQCRMLAVAAVTHGNGILEVTARGSLQIRGLRPETVEPLRAAIDAAEIVPQAGVAIEIPPLAGLDASEVADARAMASALRASINALRPVLAPKLSIIIDGGGRFNLSAFSADIRLKAIANASAPLWAVSIGGDERTARPLAILPAASACRAVTDLLRLLSDLGAAARGRDIEDFPSLPWVQQGVLSPMSAPAPPIAGLHDVDGIGRVLGLGLAYGQIYSAELVRFLDIAEAHGAEKIRLAPERGLFVLGLGDKAFAPVREAARACGLRTEGDDPANHVATCAGAGGCASAFYATRDMAGAVLELAPELLDGSLTVHLSGCPKGCAHPRSAAITLVGAPIGYGLVVNGSAYDEPLAYIERDNIRSVLRTLSGLVRDNKDAGESARACLTRLGAEEIAKAVQQG
ncbi:MULTISPECIES: precorrin-3B synthase [unclassified Sinorhizobium]|uniref:precorrin-3B synthase n=1 Tax=unclassified Sinorhizobium TaxID=2613772 RepID=UPI003525E8C2